MPNDARTTAALRKIAQGNSKLRRAAVNTGLSAARAAIKDAVLEAVGVRYDLAEIDDQGDRSEGVEEMNQKIGGFVREADKTLSQLEHLAGILDEIQREAPRIAARLNVDLGGAP